MESTVYSANVLAAIASVAVAIAGFSGVVVALTGKTTDTYRQTERLNLRILLQVSALAVLFSLLPLILHRALEPSVAWRTAMLLYGFAHLADAGFFTFKTGRLSSPSRVQLLAPWAGVTIAVVQVLLGLFGPIGWVEVGYLLVLIWHLGIAGMGFANLIFASHG